MSISFYGDMVEKTRDAVLKRSEDGSGGAPPLALVDAVDSASSGVVVPVNCLPLEYMLGQNGIPLHRSITLQGPTESCKSSIFWFMVRVFLANGGLAAYFDLENKHDPELSQAYIGNPIANTIRPPHGRVALFRCRGPERLGPALTEFSHKLLAAFEKTGQWRPVIIGVDTLGSSVLSSYGDQQRLKAKTDPGYLYAQTASAVQATLMSWLSAYVNILPVTLVCLLQERKELESNSVKATGGAFSSYARSIGLRMRRTGYWDTLDERYPVLGMSQEKMSQNTKRKTSLTIPTQCVRNAAGFREYSLDWSYAMLNLLADLPETLTAGLFSVKRKTEKTFSVVLPPKDKRTSEAGVIYQTSPVAYRELGDAMVNDSVLREELRRRLHISTHPLYPAPYRIPDLLSGRMWVSPDDLSEEDLKAGVDAEAMPEDEILKRHAAYMVGLLEENRARTEEARKEAADHALAAENDEDAADASTKGTKKRSRKKVQKDGDE